jgi:hypothetical protein
MFPDQIAIPQTTPFGQVDPTDLQTYRPTDIWKNTMVTLWCADAKYQFKLIFSRGTHVTDWGCRHVLLFGQLVAEQVVRSSPAMINFAKASKQAIDAISVSLDAVRLQNQLLTNIYRRYLVVSRYRSAVGLAGHTKCGIVAISNPDPIFYNAMWVRGLILQMPSHRPSSFGMSCRVHLLLLSSCLRAPYLSPVLFSASILLNTSCLHYPFS